MHEDKVTEIQAYLTRRLPDCRISTHYDFDRESQRFRIRHGRMTTHILLVEETAVNSYSRDQLNRLLDRALDHLRLTAPAVQVRVGGRGVSVEQIPQD